MARPTKEPHEKRSAARPAVRLTQAELTHLQSLAASARLPVSDYVRQRLLSGKVTPRPSADQASLLTELNRIGVNLNQIARQLNRGDQPDPHHLDFVLGQLVDALRRVARAYGA